MDYFLDEDVEMELLSAIAFEEDIMTWDEQHLDDNTITIPESQPPNTEAATSFMEAANPTEVAASPNELASSVCLNSNSHPSGLRLLYPHPSNNVVSAVVTDFHIAVGQELNSMKVHSLCCDKASQNWRIGKHS